MLRKHLLFKGDLAPICIFLCLLVAFVSLVLFYLRDPWLNYLFVFLLDLFVFCWFVVFLCLMTYVEEASPIEADPNCVSVGLTTEQLTTEQLTTEQH